jgi:hypothetical protein
MQIVKDENGNVVLNPIDESQLEDKRHNIAENCFLELEIALKGYRISFGEDATYDGVSILHSTLAYLLGNHKNNHRLANIDIENFDIPKSNFKTKDGVPTDKIYHLTDFDKLHYFTNLIMNSKLGIKELTNSSYFEGLETDNLLIDKNSIMYHLMFQYDNSILLMNNKYSKLTFNF